MQSDLSRSVRLNFESPLIGEILRQIEFVSFVHMVFFNSLWSRGNRCERRDDRGKGRRFAKAKAACTSHKFRPIVSLDICSKKERVLHNYNFSRKNETKKTKYKRHIKKCKRAMHSINLFSQNEDLPLLITHRYDFKKIHTVGHSKKSTNTKLSSPFCPPNKEK